MRIFIAFLLGLALLPIWPESGEAAQLPTLPQATVDTTYSLPTGTTYTPANSAAFATALSNAAPNDVIVLTAGVTYTGPFTLPNKTSGSGWIYIISSALASLPAAGTRVAPADAINMPKIRTTTSNSAAIVTASAAHHYRFVGIEMANEATTLQNGVLDIGTGESNAANLPHHIIVERCYVHGHTTNGGRRGISMNGNSIAVIDSYISDFKEVGADTQALWAYNGAGPFKIVNNFLSASGENVMFGGADPRVSGLVPSDIEIRRNYFFKPLAWKGSAWTVKNLLEFKNARRILVEGNVFENSWTGEQNGTWLVITPRNQSGGAAWDTIEDLTVRYNRVLNVGEGVRISGTDDNQPSQITTRVLIEHNLMIVANVANEFVRCFIISNPSSNAHAGPNDLTIRHNTGLSLTVGATASFSAMLGSKANSFDFRDNLLSAANAGFAGNNTADGTGSLNGHYTNYTFTNNALIGTSGTYPSGNFFPATNAAVKFANFAGGDYRLASASPYKAGAAQGASDGTDLGANMDAIDAAIGGTASPQLPAPTNLRVR